MIMALLEYTQFGVAIFSIAALVFCVGKFLEFMKQQEVSFKNTVDNHLDSLKEASGVQSRVQGELCKAVDELIRFLRYQNKK